MPKLLKTTIQGGVYETLTLDIFFLFLLAYFVLAICNSLGSTTVGLENLLRSNLTSVGKYLELQSELIF